MRLYECTLTFHENLYYETRTLGRLYETGRLLHNIALGYALGLAQTTYYHADYVPQYAAELAPLNEAGIYVTPAAGLDLRYSINTFKFGAEKNAILMEPSNDNLPTFGRAKEVAVGSIFRFAILCEQALTLPPWLRMGIWMSKARLTYVEYPLERRRGERTETVHRYPLNQADLPATATLKLFDLVSMRPSSLVENALITADDWWVYQPEKDQTCYLPVGMKYYLGR
ncbi:MAG: hypothetical protein OHK0023_17910 [Anaerolineae bacterium]